ncbi:MAG: hypothetical protein H6R20_284 [Proteobacteria bacterium]|jgi:hypothetical protein|nr:hypothetical protein [Pseudomonadota bacterium]
MAAFTRRRFLSATGAVALAGCATQPLGVADPTSVPAPNWKIGDEWLYKRTDGYTKLDAGSPVARRVVEAGSAGIRITETTASNTFIDNAVYANPSAMLSGTLSEFGPITGRFEPPLQHYDFPLVSGKRWSQRLNRIDSGGFRYFMTLDASVEGWETLEVAGRKLRAIAIRRYFMLGQLPPGLGLSMGNSFRWDTEWYAPDLGSFVTLNRQERYQPERVRIMADAPGNWFLLQLESFKRA